MPWLKKVDSSANPFDPDVGHRNFTRPGSTKSDSSSEVLQREGLLSVAHQYRALRGVPSYSPGEDTGIPDILLGAIVLCPGSYRAAKTMKVKDGSCHLYMNLDELVYVYSDGHIA